MYVRSGRFRRQILHHIGSMLSFVYRIPSANIAPAKSRAALSAWERLGAHGARLRGLWIQRRRVQPQHLWTYDSVHTHITYKSFTIAPIHI